MCRLDVAVATRGMAKLRVRRTRICVHIVGFLTVTGFVILLYLYGMAAALGVAVLTSFLLLVTWPCK